MAQCVCGCGNRVRWGRKRLNRSAREIIEAWSLLDSFLAMEPPDPRLPFSERTTVLILSNWVSNAIQAHDYSIGDGDSAPIAPETLAKDLGALHYSLVAQARRLISLNLLTTEEADRRFSLLPQDNAVSLQFGLRYW
jgi:hypothetical protein